MIFDRRERVEVTNIFVSKEAFREWVVATESHAFLRYRSLLVLEMFPLGTL